MPKGDGWTEERRKQQSERLKARHKRMYEVKSERIRRDAERAEKLKTTDEEKADDILRMMFGNEGGIQKAILRGRDE